MTSKHVQQDAREQLAARDRRRARFAGTVSHDLKTPLNAIVGFTSVLMADAGQLSAEQQRQLKLVYESSQALLGRINDLLLLYRLEAGRVDPAETWVLPAELMMQLAGHHRPAAVEQGGDLSLDLSQAPARILIDGELVRTVLEQLIKNAVRFGGGGTAKLSVRPEAAGQAGRLRVRFGVENGSQGLVADQEAPLRAALDPDRPYLEQSFDGLGLGLALSREAARLLNGWIDMQLPAGGPARFDLVLDLAAEVVERD